MATFTTTWNTAYEALPPDTGEAASLGASRIRNFKETARERIEIDHYLDGDAHDGKHKKVTFKAQGSNPTLETGDSALFSKVVSSITELFWKDDDANVYQITSGGVIQPFESGTRMLFQQTSAPTGWTKDTTDTNERALRVVSGSVGSGGSTNFTTVFGSSKNTGSTAPGTDSQGSHNHSASTGSAGSHTHSAANNGSHTHGGGSTGSHGLSVSEMPSHTHQFAVYEDETGGSDRAAAAALSAAIGTVTTTSSGSGAGHTHTISANGTHSHTINPAGSHSHSIGSDGSHSHTVASHTHSLSLNLLYLDVIIAVKD